MDDVDAMSDPAVESISSRRCRVTCSSTSRKGRYLFTEPVGVEAPLPFMAMSPSASALDDSLLEEDWGGDWDG